MTFPPSPMMMSTSYNFSNTTSNKQKQIMSAITNKIVSDVMSEAAKTVSPPPPLLTPLNKEATVMIDIKDMTHRGKPPKKTPNGNKMYVSSKVVDALQYMKKHTEELSMKRTMQKERL